VVALVLPLAALATFILMRRFGMSANLMSLGGLAIAIGMLVDAAVVVVENIVSTWRMTRKGEPLPPLHVVYRAVREVAVPVASGITDHRHRVPAAADAAGAGGQAVRAGGADHRLRAGRLAAAVADGDPGARLLPAEAGGHGEPWLPRKLLRLRAAAGVGAARHAPWWRSAPSLMLAVAALVYTQVGKTFMPTMDEGDLIVRHREAAVDQPGGRALALDLRSPAGDPASRARR
jgi:cobalt-zinc-cadmium resistance protein CzcA